MSNDRLCVPLGEVSVQVPCPSFHWTVCFCVLGRMSSVHTRAVNPWSDVSLARLLSQSVDRLFVSLMASFAGREL